MGILGLCYLAMMLILAMILILIHSELVLFMVTRLMGGRQHHWDRLRAPPIDTSPHDLHISDCLNDLHPRDHTEIQWRGNKQFPYGWWYGVVGHIEACDGNEIHCHCHESEPTDKNEKIYQVVVGFLCN